MAKTNVVADKVSKTYDASSIKTMKGLEGVRARPTMYIGSIGSLGTNHLCRELVDNSVDEYFDGHCKSIVIQVDDDLRGILVKDDGRGIPAIETDKKLLQGYIPSIGKPVPKGGSALERIVTVLHSGGKFEAGNYTSSAGLNGVGTSAVVALSEIMTVTTTRDGFEWQQKFAKGKTITQLTPIKEAKKGVTGTTVYFKPDFSIMQVVDHDGNITDEALFDLESIRSHCSVQSYLNAGLKFTMVYQKQQEVFHHPEGITEYVRDLNSEALFKKVAYFKAKDEKTNIDVEIAIGYSKGSSDGTMTFVNSIFTSEGGTHLTGFRISLANIVKEVICDHKLLSKKEEDLEITGDDCREGLVAIVSIKHPAPQFQGQTKQRLGNTDAQGVVQRLMNVEFKHWLLANPEEAKIVGKKAIAAAKATKAAKSARERVQRQEGSSFLSMNNVGKLAACTSKNPEECEVFLVEGKQ